MPFVCVAVALVLCSHFPLLKVDLLFLDFLYSSMLSAISYALPLQFWNQSDSKHRNASTSSNVTGNE
jgi:hypothetical protein